MLKCGYLPLEMLNQCDLEILNAKEISNTILENTILKDTI